MSWSSYGKLNSFGSLISGYTDTSQMGYGEEESKAQMAQAKIVAGNLVASGLWGTGDFSVVLNGHANPGGEPQDNWSRDYVSIQIQNVKLEQEIK